MTIAEKTVKKLMKCFWRAGLKEMVGGVYTQCGAFLNLLFD